MAETCRRMLCYEIWYEDERAEYERVIIPGFKKFISYEERNYL